MARVDLSDEARRLQPPVATVHSPGPGRGQEQEPLGARHADIGEPAFFLDLPVVNRGHVREQLFFHAHEKHDAELEPLGRVNRQQPHAATAAAVGVAVGQ